MRQPVSHAKHNETHMSELLNRRQRLRKRKKRNIILNTVCILLVFIWKMSFNHRNVELGKWPRNCLIAADVVLVVIMAAMMALSHPGLRGLIGL